MISLELIFIKSFCHLDVEEQVTVKPLTTEDQEFLDDYLEYCSERKPDDTETGSDGSIKSMQQKYISRKCIMYNT